jgi:hypothetical protein
MFEGQNSKVKHRRGKNPRGKSMGTKVIGGKRLGGGRNSLGRGKKIWEQKTKIFKHFKNNKPFVKRAYTSSYAIFQPNPNCKNKILQATCQY